MVRRRRQPGLLVEALEDRTVPATVATNYGQLPLAFEPNVGQAAAGVNFVAHGTGYGLALTPTEAVLALGHNGDTLGLELLGANPTARAAGQNLQAGVSNYLIGNDPTQWHTGVANYGGVRYQGVYTGIDLVYYGNQRQLEYDFDLAPGADPAAIRLRFSGASGESLDGTGDLVLHTAGGDVIERAPVLYQTAADGSRCPVSGGYVLAPDGTASFAVGAYDRSRPLVIDPTLSYSTYLGGSGVDQATGVAVDAAGEAFVVGFTRSTNFPAPHPLQAANAGLTNAFVSKLNAAGTALVYSTYLGGSVSDEALGVAVDAAGDVYVVGVTTSTNFPTTNRPLQAAIGGGTDAFVSKLNAAGTALVYSTYLGGSGTDIANAVAVDAAGEAYVVGSTTSTNFPTADPLQAGNAGSTDAFVAKLNVAGTGLVYSTYLGAFNSDSAYGVAVDAAGEAYVVGDTQSTNFPTVNPLPAGNGNAGGVGAFVSKLNAAGTALVYSTYLGGSGDDHAYGVAVDAAGDAYVVGVTTSTDFPTANPLQAAIGATTTAFVSKLNAAGTALVYSTYLGGSSADLAFGVAVDAAGEAYVIGDTASTNFPTANPLQAANGGGTDAFVSKLNAAGTALVYSTYLGGSSNDDATGVAVDAAGSAYVVGYTTSTNFPTAGPLQATNGGTTDAFVTKIATPSTSAAVSVVAPTVPTDATHFTSLAAALLNVAAGGTVTVEPGAVADPFPVPVGLAVTITGDPNVPAAILPRYDLVLDAGGVTLTNLNLGAVTIASGVGTETLRHCALVSLTAAAGSSGHTTIDQCTVTGSVSLAGTTNAVTNCAFTGTAPVMLALDGAPSTTVQGNTFTGTAPAQTGIDVYDSSLSVVSNNTIVLSGTGPATVALAARNDMSSDQVNVTTNVLQTAGGVGLVVRDVGQLFSSVLFQVPVQGNDFHGDAIGVDFLATNLGTLKLDLGGGALGSLGGNDFHSFTAAATPTAAAILVRGLGTGGTIPAQHNLFAATVTPANLVNGPAGSVDVSTPLTADQAFVQTLFNQVLGRTGTLTELNSLVAALHAPGQSQATLAHALLYSTEALDRVVYGLYLRFLGRASAPSEEAPWVAELQGGATLEAVQSGFIASPEFRSHNDTDFIQALFIDVLGRTGNTAELASWNPIIQEPGGFQLAATVFAQAPENRLNAATADVRTFLHRTPSATERDGLVSAGGSLLGIELAVLSSNEFYTNG
jgi:hypothetical protein